MIEAQSLGPVNPAQKFTHFREESAAPKREKTVVRGLNRMTFIVADLDRMEEILTRVFDARKVYDSGAETFSVSKERFFLIGDGAEPIWVAIMEGEPLPARTYNHVAFKIDDRDYEDYLQRIRALGLEMREGRSRVAGEGQSIYFYDVDNHMFELHTGTLDERLKRYAEGR
jgi:catechol 2,3-dioxygenase-like lactoylglutathione lyase family enzyme